METGMFNEPITVRRKVKQDASPGDNAGYSRLSRINAIQSRRVWAYLDRNQAGTAEFGDFERGSADFRFVCRYNKWNALIQQGDTVVYDGDDLRIVGVMKDRRHIPPTMTLECAR